MFYHYVDVEDKTKKVIILYSFSLICGQKSEEDLDEVIKTYDKDKKYCHKAYKKNKDVILVSADQQIKKSLIVL